LESKDSSYNPSKGFQPIAKKSQKRTLPVAKASKTSATGKKRKADPSVSENRDAKRLSSSKPPFKVVRSRKKRVTHNQKKVIVMMLHRHHVEKMVTHNQKKVIAMMLHPHHVKKIRTHNRKKVIAMMLQAHHPTSTPRSLVVLRPEELS
jgi:hypothetical protein